MLLAQIILSGITAGAVYALVALGFVLIYKGTHVIHFGLGEQVALGAYLVSLLKISTGLTEAGDFHEPAVPSRTW
jgi:branched-chain amino acid transport system permease protein